MKKAHLRRYARPTRSNVLQRTPSLVDLRVPRICDLLDRPSMSIFEKLKYVIVLGSCVARHSHLKFFFV